ncbi:unnamed protein product [Caenorhabditis bovis]|uniref:Uncharacterized protein n=1 Tax=Caenorhabditis bovis TaxID=2654633 RepID=A0A8S1EPG3_9PELO|nr:unnamed protein product [Caenorhabditis bovis]
MNIPNPTLKNNKEKDSFTVYEEASVEETQQRSDVACQTQIRFESCQVQTNDSAIPTEMSEEEDELISYWNRVLSQNGSEIERIKKLNDELENEIARAKRELNDKKDIYNRIFAKAARRLDNRNRSSSASSSFSSKSSEDDSPYANEPDDPIIVKT